MELSADLLPSLTQPNIKKIFDALGNDKVRFVGGCVRNLLLGLPIGDIDFATILPPEDVTKALTRARIKVVPTGIEHGTVTAVLDGTGYEITTLRRDVETDGRRAVVAYSTDWGEDAARRDFTINALYADLNGTIFDPLGTGLSDIEKRKIRFVGVAEDRIQEDYLRILRFFRFQSLYGHGKPDRSALIACQKFAKKIDTLSKERITQEFKKIVLGPHPTKILQLMQDCRILPQLLSKKFIPKQLDHLIKLQKLSTDLSNEQIFISRLLAILGYKIHGNFANLTSLTLSRRETTLIQSLANSKSDFSHADFREDLYLNPRDFVRLDLLRWANNQNLSAPAYRKMVARLEETPVPVFPVTGRDLLEAGFTEGAALGAHFKKLEKKWIKSGFCLGKSDLIPNK